MADDKIASIKDRLAKLKTLRGELESIKKEAFMAAPPMPAGGGGAPMDPAMMGGGGMPPGGMPPGGMPPGGMPPGGMPPGGMPPGGAPMDPAMMGGGAMPPVDPATGMPMDPAAAGGAPMDPAAAGGAPPITPEMLEELMGVIEGLAAASEEQEVQMQQLAQQNEEVLGRLEELDQRVAQQASQAAAGVGAFEMGG